MVEDLIRARTGEGRCAGRGARAENGPTVQAHRSPEARGDQAPRAGRNPCRHRPQLTTSARRRFRGSQRSPLEMATEPDKPIVKSYAEIVREPPTYVATLYPLAEVEWMRLKSVDISSAFLGAAVTAMLPIVVPSIQYLSNRQLDYTLIWVFVAGLVLLVINTICGRYFNTNRMLTIKKIDAHFRQYGVGVS